jgi:hypothetical protein
MVKYVLRSTSNPLEPHLHIMIFRLYGTETPEQSYNLTISVNLSVFIGGLTSKPQIC